MREERRGSVEKTQKSKRSKSDRTCKKKKKLLKKGEKR